jgi:hypothetical protein
MSQWTTDDYGFTRLVMTPLEIPDWHDLTQYEPQAGYPKPAKSMKDLLGNWRAGIWVNSKSLVFSNRAYSDERSADNEAIRKVAEMRG